MKKAHNRSSLHDYAGCFDFLYALRGAILNFNTGGYAKYVNMLLRSEIYLMLYIFDILKFNFFYSKFLENNFEIYIS